MSGKLILALLLATVVAAPVALRPPPPVGADELRLWTTHSTEKVRPYDPPGAAAAVEIAAARNEFESFQIVLYSAGRGDIRDVDVEVSALADDLDNRIDERYVTAYLVDYIDVGTPSSRQGATGEWPDPLVPRTDHYFGERRNAFPFSVSPGRNQSLWIEVYVPTETPPGLYEGVVTITVGGNEDAAVPVQLQVWPFTLPSTATLPTSFGFAGSTALRQHDGDLTEISELYGRAALLHRISLHGGTWRPPEVVRAGGGFSLDWDAYDEEMGAFLNGTVLGDGDPLPGAEVTSVDMRAPDSLGNNDERNAYWRAWAEHFRENGWFDRLFFYLWDEPQTEDDYARVLELGREIRRADPEIRLLLTEDFVAPLAEVVDIWVPLINCVEAKPDHEPWCDGPARPLETAGSSAFWWYQSCASHGCNIVGDNYFDGWPSYVIDAPAVGNRVMQWLAWRYRIEGELYYNTVEGYGLGVDPWRDVHLFGGNGEGTLFYPGTPDRIGGRHEIPIESIRLKLIRDGLEDYEYLVLLEEAAGDREFAEGQAETVAAALFSWSPDPDLLLGARYRIAERLSSLLANRAEQ